MLVATDKCGSHYSSKKFLSQEIETITESITVSNTEDNLRLGLSSDLEW